MSLAKSIVWFRQDLRLADNPALVAASGSGVVIPVFIWAPEEEDGWQPGAASQWWLHQSLRALETALQKLGSKIIFRHGNSLKQLRSILQETGATRVYWNRRYEPAALQRDKDIEDQLGAEGFEVVVSNSHLLFEPWTIANKSRNPFRVFTPFWKACLEVESTPKPLSTPQKLLAPECWPKTLALDELALEPKVDWAKDIRSTWQPGELGAHSRLRNFLHGPVFNYDAGRNSPGEEGTSCLSPHLHFGEIGVRQVWSALEQAAQAKSIQAEKWKHWQYVTELGWREFAHHLLFHFPNTPDEPLRPEFKELEWRRNPEWLKAWQRGQTGYPIVDAGMRELWTTGWMHNRVRMVVASFLVKDLLQPWQDGARWFWDTLVDADLANNTLGWQWCAGCGADAMPFFRIFNPTSQGEKFDEQGSYVRRWVPELAPMPNQWIHKPWQAPESVLRAAGIVLGKTYPEPIVSHEIARHVALEALQKTKPAATLL